MARADWLYAPLQGGAIYEYDGALLQAWAHGETWPGAGSPSKQGSLAKQLFQ